jgi:hypothetical protein
MEHRAKDAGTFPSVPKRNGQAPRRTFTFDTLTVSYCRKTSNPLPPHSLMLRWIWNWVKMKIFGWCISRTRHLSRDQFERITTVHTARIALWAESFRTRYYTLWSSAIYTLTYSFNQQSRRTKYSFTSDIYSHGISSRRRKVPYHVLLYNLIKIGNQIFLENMMLFDWRFL